MSRVVEIDHPLIQHKLTNQRKKDTGSKDFRRLTAEIAMLMCYEATRDLRLQDTLVETPLEVTTGEIIKGKELAVVPVLRSGLGMVEGIIKLVPSVKVGHIGIYRDPELEEPIEYYCKLPVDCAERDVILLDAMIGSGRTASAAIDLLKEKGIRHIKLMCLCIAPAGVDRLQKDHPDVDLYIASIDKGISESGYVRPGLGDAADRMWGTK